MGCDDSQLFHENPPHADWLPQMLNFKSRQTPGETFAYSEVSFELLTRPW